MERRSDAAVAGIPRISCQKSCMDCQKFFDCPKPLEVWEKTREKIPFGMYERFAERQKSLAVVFKNCQEKQL